MLKHYMCAALYVMLVFLFGVWEHASAASSRLDKTVDGGGRLRAKLCLCLFVLPTENEEADDSQQGPENERETCRPQSLRCQRRKTQGWRENIHHLREGDAFLTDGLTKPLAILATSPENNYKATLSTTTQNRKCNKWLGLFCFVWKKQGKWKRFHRMM